MEESKSKASMDAIIELLRAELSVLSRLSGQAEAQKQALKDNLNGKAVSETTTAVSATLRELGGCEEKKAALLSAIGVSTLTEAVARQPYSKEKRQARELLGQLRELYGRLRGIVETSKSLLAHDAEYLTFNLNVMAEASAAPSYGTPDTQASATQGRKLFDESV